MPCIIQNFEVGAKFSHLPSMQHEALKPPHQLIGLFTGAAGSRAKIHLEILWAGCVVLHANGHEATEFEVWTAFLDVFGQGHDIRGLNPIFALLSAGVHLDHRPFSFSMKAQ